MVERRNASGAQGEPTSTLVTYLLIDGENLDATLGSNLLGRQPAPRERPRWDRALEFSQRVWGNPVKALFFINASSGTLPMGFLQFLQAAGIRPVLLSGPPGTKVVDEGILRTLRALADRPGDVMLGSHDGDFAVEIDALLGGDRRVALLAFREFVSTVYAPMVERGLTTFDLEDDAATFDYVLPRMRIIDIDDFDPVAFL